jgi:MFS family permease
MSVMYATQPLQPLLASKFNISIIEASQFTAVILFFLAVAPIIYGYILEKVNAKKMLINASIVLLITNILLGLSQNYELFLFFRVCEALVIPAILTSLMSILANIDSENIKFNMSIYVAGTVFGGLVGRIFSGFIATTFSYEYVFYSLSVAILISILLIRKLDFNGDANIIKPRISDVINILKDKRFLIIYFIMFFVFFVFSGVSGLKLLYFSEANIIKIDRFFISNIDQDSKKKLFCSSIIDMAHIMGMQVIAEGVETQKEFYTCKDIGADFIQGFLVQKPTKNINEILPIYNDISNLILEDKREV